ncbi:MAG: 50S ribosomal protein L25/general stress protein Ctc [Actinomycetota bacterium]|nr:50S ribosomal protein L25/general stress protein Ctc [Actinomycetota bacterium]MDA2980867.1 50S ribosomal protein L25/general stress protein Ctc [Actinomycetota bacterium]MDA3003385.1 50S ribosomal protein L25/general stress protein Ctc [Actinomycetota bacterium]
MVDNHVAVDIRTSFGKGAARKLRAAGKIPAVVYGHGADPLHVALPAHETTLIARRANALIELKTTEGEQLVLIKDIQRDPVRQIIEHLDLVIVRKGEKVTVDISVHVEGEPFSGTMVQLEHNTVSVEAEATHIPEYVTVNVDGLEEGAQIRAGELVLPDGATLVSEPDMLVLSIQQPPKVVEPEPGATAEGEAGGEGGAPAEGGDSGGDSGDSDSGGSDSGGE